MILGAFDRPEYLSASSHLDTRNASAALLHNSWQGSSNTSRSSAGSFGALSSPYDGSTVPTTPTSSRSRETFPAPSREPSIDEATQPFTTSHSHWCFICPNPRVITTCDGWKRHMKEHETRYRCMPRGPIEYTIAGAKCAFCGLLEPSQSHCDTHKAYPCAKKPLDVRSYTRKPHFLTHLKTHNILNGAELANQWKDTTNKKHFSCGFCISHFDTLIEQLNHIDIIHYRLFQHVRDWDSNNVIRGLLLQPRVAESWRRLLESHPGVTESLLRWNLSVTTQELQFRLEMGNEHAEDLAKLAFNRGTTDLNYQAEALMVDAAEPSHHSGVFPSQRIPVTENTGPIHFDSRESPIVDENMMNPSAPHMGQHRWPWTSLNTSAAPHSHFLSRGGTDVSEENATGRMQQLDSDPSQRLMSSGGNYQNQSDSSLAPWTNSKAFGFNLTTTNNATISDYWQATPILSPMNSSSIVANQLRHQSQHSVGSVRARHASQNLPPTSVRKASPMVQAPRLFSTPNPISQPRKKSSRSKLKDHYDINTEADTDLDFDKLQRLMREEDSTRSERRNR